MFSGCTSKNVKLVEEESFLSDFTVENNTVHINCKIVLKNIANEDKTVTIKGSFAEDVDGGLLKEEDLYACDENGNKKEFLVEANSQTSFDITFMGDYGGTYQKQNRLLPEITIVEIKK